MGVVKLFSRAQRETFVGRALSAIRGTSTRQDAVDTVLFSRDLESIQAGVVRDEFPEYVNRRILPDPGGVAPGSRTHTWRRLTPSGAAKMISNYATDYPNVSAVGREITTPIRPWGAMFTYSLRDVAAAGLAGMSPSAELARTARDSIEQARERVMMLGDTATGIPGLLNNANVPLVASGYVGNWDAGARTGAEVIRDVRRFAATIMEQSLDRHQPPFVMVVSPAIMTILRTLQVSIYDSRTVDVFLSQTDNLEIVSTPYATLADAQTDGPRIVMFRSSPEVLRAIAPVDYQETAPQPRGFNLDTYVEGEFGGVVIQRPLACLYVDGIFDGAN